jgi:hypothetical protein
MDAAPRCVHCGTPATGTHFCTSCGAPLPGPAPDAPVLSFAPADVPVHGAPTSTAALPHEPVAVSTAAATAPWLAAQPTARPPRKRLDVMAVLVAGALVLSVWAFVRGIEEHTFSGTVTLVDSADAGFDPGDSCTGENGYDDVRGGAQVIVTDGRGDTLSTGRLSAGEFDGFGCVFSFALQDVTRADFYTLTVAGGRRGELQYSYDELAENDWSVQLSLGDI